MMTRRPKKTLNCHRSRSQLLEEDTNVGGILDSTQEASFLPVSITVAPVLEHTTLIPKL
jgi:hypothetical protein